MSNDNSNKPRTILAGDVIQAANRIMVKRQRKIDAVSEHYARKLFHIAHPRRDWQKFPNYKQSQEQDKYRRAAAALIGEMIRDADILDIFADAINH